MPSAILHAATRVIRRLTTDPAPTLLADEIAATVADGFDLAGGPWKLAVDNVTKTAATNAELDEAFKAPVSPEVLALRAAAIALGQSAAAVRDKNGLPQEVRTMAGDLVQFLIAMRDFYKDRRSN